MSVWDLKLCKFYDHAKNTYKVQTIIKANALITAIVIVNENTKQGYQLQFEVFVNKINEKKLTLI